ncbi:MAG: hypothetical protein ABSC06_31695 [Rhodopila sp.]|jgi:hypothetical protein
MRDLILTITGLLGVGYAASAVAVQTQATIPVRAPSGVPLPVQSSSGGATSR